MITSRQNPLIKHIRRLGTDAAYRKQQGLFLCDGRKLLDDALRSGIVPKTVLLSGGTSVAEMPEETQTVIVPPALMESISPLESPQGVLFACGIPNPPPVPPKKGRFLMLDRLQDPGNVGSILRTAEAFALDGVYLTRGCADPFGPKAVRASMGAVFRLPCGIVSQEAVLGGTLPVFATDAGGGAEAIDKISFSDCVVVLGNEGQGISRELRGRADKTVCIPMRGGAESLGVAAAAAIIAWHLSR